MVVDPEILDALKRWKQTTDFSADNEWLFASPAKSGHLPLSYPWIWRVFQKAATEAGIGTLGTHSLRHTYRSWLDAAGTPIAVQQKLMRHSDIRTTMNIYGDVVTDEMATAHSKVGSHGAARHLSNQRISMDFTCSKCLKTWRREWDCVPTNFKIHKQQWKNRSIPL